MECGTGKGICIHVDQSRHFDHRVPIQYRGDGEVTQDVINKRLHYSNTKTVWASYNISKGNRFISQSRKTQNIN